MKLFIGSAVWRSEETAYSQSLRQFVRLLDRERIKYVDGTVVGDALISRARSIVASAFLRTDCDTMISIDSDIWFREEDALSLALKAQEHGVIAAMYMTRSLQGQPALMLPPDETVLFAPESKPVRVPFVSTGFMAVHRRVFESLSEDLPKCHQGWSDRGVDTSFWPFYMPYVIPWEGDGHMYLSEDWAFCQRAKDKGQDIWLDPSIRLGHMGSYMFTLEDMIRAPRPEAKPLRMRRDRDGHLSTEVAERVLA